MVGATRAYFLKTRDIVKSKRSEHLLQSCFSTLRDRRTQWLKQFLTIHSRRCKHEWSSLIDVEGIKPNARADRTLPNPMTATVTSFSRPHVASCEQQIANLF